MNIFSRVQKKVVEMRLQSQLDVAVDDCSEKYLASRRKLIDYLNGLAIQLHNNELIPQGNFGITRCDSTSIDYLPVGAAVSDGEDGLFHFALWFLFGKAKNIEAIVQCTAKPDPDRVIFGLNGSSEEYVMPNTDFFDKIKDILIADMKNTLCNPNQGATFLVDLAQRT